MLIAAATKAPDDPAEAAKTVWDAYYANHQKNPQFQRLKVADIFMGGGTTVVEGARLGMQMYGNDLNPVAWLVVKNELAKVDPQRSRSCWTPSRRKSSHRSCRSMPATVPVGIRENGRAFDRRDHGRLLHPLSLTPKERPDYEYAGPEVIYTFWAKHGPCQATECHHRTPIMTTPVVAMKSMTIAAWTDHECSQCGNKFDIEQKDARMAPAALFVMAEDEKPYAVMSDKG